jgi:hypothetical protein
METRGTISNEIFTIQIMGSRKRIILSLDNNSYNLEDNLEEVGNDKV